MGNSYYNRYPVRFKFLAGYHGFGQFTSLLSGFNKIIGLKELTMVRNPASRALFPILVDCKISAYVYKPDPPPEDAAPRPKPVSAAPRAGGGDKD
jgi:Tfp pilus assembly protein PilO